MSNTIEVKFQSIEHTEAAIGIVGVHSVIADRPVGRAGGMGMGFNGGQLLALAIGGCLCNDLRYVAHQRGVGIQALRVSVSVDFDGEPMLATAAIVHVDCVLQDGSDASSLIDEAKRSSTVANSIQQGITVNFG